MVFRKIGIVFAALAGLAVAACSNVPPGHEGVVVSKTGSGVQEQEVGEGWHFIPPTEELIIYNLRQQDFRFEAENRRVAGCDVDSEERAFCVRDTDGMRLGLNIGVRFNVEQGSSDDLVRRFGGSLETIIYGPIQQDLFDALNQNAQALTAEQIFGPERTSYLQAVEAQFLESVGDLPLTNVSLQWIGDPALPANVRRAIDQKIEAEQVAQRRENEIATAEAEAEIAIQQARGESESRLLRATAEAEALRIQGEALRENPDIIMLNLIEAWGDNGGNVPEILVVGDGGALPILDMVGAQQ